MRVRQCLLTTAMAVVMVGCSPDQESLAPSETSADVRVTPMCQAGCIDPDPEPEADGYFLGSSVEPYACTTGVQTDTDADGLSDFCEKNLAAAFAPELKYDPIDDTRGEPHWVARPLSFGKVRIAYLLSYYLDISDGNLGCSTLGIASCNGHLGDSEAVYLDVKYTHGRWQLDAARYAHHTSITTYIPGQCTMNLDNICPYLEFPDVNKGYPRVWVASGKHGSYASRAECNKGGVTDADTCEDNTARRRVPAGQNLNLGSRAVHTPMQDSMPSSNNSYEHYGKGRYEAYWTSKPFRGWIPDSVAPTALASDPYSAKLAQQGF
jgi:hypothetical protein